MQISVLADWLTKLTLCHPHVVKLVSCPGPSSSSKIMDSVGILV